MSTATPTSPITDAYIVHHSHTDLGYTDLPSTVWDLHAEYTREAMALCEATARYPKAARFRWTHEVLGTLEHFLRAASPGERRRLARLVRAGQVEVCAMPWNLQPHWEAAEWAEALRRFDPLFAAYRPTVAMQNDVNGFPWGMLPELTERGVTGVWMGVNVFSGGTPLERPRPFWWAGPTGQRVLVWQGESYPNGYFYFHEIEWRKGPVTASHDVWGNRPAPGETWACDEASLRAAAVQFTKRLAARAAGYPYTVLPLQVTNMWRIDNDPPCGQISDFVRAWNRLRLTPRLHFSTPSEFLRVLARRHGKEIPSLRGDWPDWWADGAASLPQALATNQRAKQVLVDLGTWGAMKREPRGGNPRKREALGEPETLARRAWAEAALFDEHTWGAYESVARPGSMRAEAMAAEKVVLAARAHELADRARAAALRADPAHAPFSRTRRVAAINPGKTARGGWITINARTLRVPVDALRDVETGEVLPLERVLAAEWAKPEGEDAPPFEVPDDVWPFVPQALRAYVPHVPPGGRRVFELVKTSPVVPVAALEGQTALWAWSFHRETGLPVKLVDLACGIDLVDRIAPFGFGQVVIERAEGGPGVRPRDALATRDPKKVAAVLKRSTPRVISAGMAPGVAGPRFVAAFEHEAVHRIEQVWDLAPGTGPGEGARAWVTTTLWLKEHHGPQAIYLSLPLALAHPKVFYDSVGHRTRVGADQIPGACGEYLAVNRGVEYETPAARVSVATPDTPLGMFDAIHARDGQTTFTPEGGHFYAMIQNTYWPTNFSHARGGKLTVRLGIGCGTTVDAMGELWAGPVT